MNEELIKKLGYEFRQPKLLTTALTHRSSQDDNNERLEFLGDAIVNFVIGEVLYRQFPIAKEGDLSRWRASLVNREALGNLAKQFDIGKHLILGAGELKTGGKERLSILSCTMEAIVGAIYLDGGFESAQACILRWYAPLVANITPVDTHKDPKTQLQEFLQSQHLTLPTYKVEEIQGESHQQVFIISCSIPGFKKTTTGKGTSRRRAEQAAAQSMLEIIHEKRK